MLPCGALLDCTKRATSAPMHVIDLLRTPLSATNYAELRAHCQDRAQAGGTHAIDFANTQIVTLRRHEPEFRALTAPIDTFVPDGMPLVWCLNAKGAGLSDRVYGPTFMRLALEAAPMESRHYLLGGSEECGQALRLRFPHVNFVGSFHGQCSVDGFLEGTAEAEVPAAINELAPDFIWIGLGTPKQYAWLHRNKSKIPRGVFLTVGFAFDVNAGTKTDAPAWMQKRGLTWLFRAVSEPRRLGIRYLRYNSLFLFYLLKDRRAQR